MLLLMLIAVFQKQRTQCQLLILLLKTYLTFALLFVRLNPMKNPRLQSCCAHLGSDADEGDNCDPWLQSTNRPCALSKKHSIGQVSNCGGRDTFNFLIFGWIKSGW